MSEYDELFDQGEAMMDERNEQLLIWEADIATLLLRYDQVKVGVRHQFSGMSDVGWFLVYYSPDNINDPAGWVVSCEDGFEIYTSLAGLIYEGLVSDDYDIVSIEPVGKRHE